MSIHYAKYLDYGNTYVRCIFLNMSPWFYYQDVARVLSSIVNKEISNVAPSQYSAHIYDEDEEVTLISSVGVNAMMIHEEASEELNKFLSWVNETYELPYASKAVIDNLISPTNFVLDKINSYIDKESEYIAPTEVNWIMGIEGINKKKVQAKIIYKLIEASNSIDADYICKFNHRTCGFANNRFTKAAYDIVFKSYLNSLKNHQE